MYSEHVYAAHDSVLSYDVTPHGDQPFTELRERGQVEVETTPKFFHLHIYTSDEGQQKSTAEDQQRLQWDYQHGAANLSNTVSKGFSRREKKREKNQKSKLSSIPDG